MEELLFSKAFLIEQLGYSSPAHHDVVEMRLRNHFRETCRFATRNCETHHSSNIPNSPLELMS